LLCGLGPSKDDDEDEANGVGQGTPFSRTTPLSPADAPTSALTSYSDWMAQLPDHIHHQPFNQVSIPGSHDSCTASLDRDGGLHPDAPELYRDVLRVLGSWAKTVAHRWSQTQDKTFPQQLDLGIRYFDLRISVRPGYEDLYLVHGFYGESVRSCLNSISSWLDKHPKEVVLLDMNHFHGLEDHHHKKLVDDIMDIFGDKLVPTLEDASQLTLAQMWKERQQTIVFYHVSFHCVDREVDFLWPSSMIPSPWPRATRVKDLIDFLDRNSRRKPQFPSPPPASPPRQHDQPPPLIPRISRHRPHFYVSQGVLTPTVYTVIGHVTSSLKDHFARHALTAVVEWLKRRRKRQHYVSSPSSGNDGPALPPGDIEGGDTNGGDDEDAINVVIADFVDLDPAYVEAVVGLNFGADHRRTLLPDSAVVDELVPVIQLIQRQHEGRVSSPRAASNDKDDDTPANPPYVTQPASQLLPPSGDTTTTTSSALSSRALTPTPLQYIDAGSNSPSVTPQRRGETTDMDGDG